MAEASCRHQGPGRLVPLVPCKFTAQRQWFPCSATASLPGVTSYCQSLAFLTFTLNPAKCFLDTGFAIFSPSLKRTPTRQPTLVGFCQQLYF